MQSESCVPRRDRISTLPSARAAPYSSMLLLTPLPTRQTRRTRRTRPNPTLPPNVLSHASFNAQQYTDLLIVDATASSCRFKALVNTGAAVNLISPTLGHLLTPLPAVQPVISKSSTTRLRFFPDLDHPPNEFALPPKLASQKVWVDDMLRKGFIRRSKSPYGANLTSASKGTDLFDGASTIDD